MNEGGGGAGRDPMMNEGKRPSAAVTSALGEQLEEAREELASAAAAAAATEMETNARPASPPPRTAVPMRVEPPDAREDEDDEGDEVWLTPRADLSPTAARQSEDAEGTHADDSGAEEASSIAAPAATQRTLFSEDTDSEDRSLVEVQSLRASVELAQHERDEQEAQASKTSTSSRGAPPHEQREEGEAVLEEEEDEIEVQSLRASVEQGQAMSTAEASTQAMRREDEGGKLFLDPLPVAVSASLGSDKSVADLLHTLDEVRFEEQQQGAASVPSEKEDEDEDDVQSRAPLMRPYTFRKQGRVEQQHQQQQKQQHQQQQGDEKDAATAPSPRTKAPIASPNKSSFTLATTTTPRDTEATTASSHEISELVDAEKEVKAPPESGEDDARQSNRTSSSRAAAALSKVAGLERTIRSLRAELAAKDKKIQDLERSRVEVKEAMRAAGDANECLTLTTKNVLDFKRELEEQEQLLVGYQQENESAMARVKELETAIKHKDEVYGEERKRTAEQVSYTHTHTLSLSPARAREYTHNLPLPHIHINHHGGVPTT